MHKVKNEKAWCVLHNIVMRHGRLLDINEDTLQDFRKRDTELHVVMPVNPNTPAAVDQLAESAGKSTSIIAICQDASTPGS